MKPVHTWLRSAFLFAMLAVLASCAAKTPTDSMVPNMSIAEAQAVLANRLSGASGARIVADSHSSERIANVRVESSRFIIEGISGKQSTFFYRELPRISFAFWTSGAIQLAGQDTFNGIIEGNRIVNALNVLKQNALNQQRASDEFDASFMASLADYRIMAASNTALPEEVNRYKVQAEGAVRDNSFNDAADLFAAALRIAPWWPAGHFNRALVLGEIGDYEMAIRSMTHYLQLVPDAPNARAAQDQIYEWARLESQ